MTDPFAMSAPVSAPPKPQIKSTGQQGAMMRQGNAAPKPSNAKKDPFADLFG